ncbi:restriction endonuclease [Salinisphaera japonica]|uniref:restriction endonuclease n=1 Tax=Salinisphaera japonica TaxID=1304270 RepID=UPI001C8473C7|nr:restriction endonuclease [Salinisphaera japonica]
MPWPPGVALAVIGYALVRYGIGWAGAVTGNPYLIAITAGFHDASFAPLAWATLGLCWLGALLAFVRQRSSSKSRRGPVEAWAQRHGPKHAAPTLDPSDLRPPTTAGPGRALSSSRDSPAPVTADNIANLSWLQFEHLIAASFRAKGFAAEVTPDGADEGVDIVLRERNNVLLVQCKHWLSKPVGVATARKLLGTLHAKNARKAVLATSNHLTPHARVFCNDNAIYVIDADTLVSFIDAGSMPGLRDIDPNRRSRCPLCGSAMVERNARQPGPSFFGCSRFPACRGRRFTLG